MLIVPLGSVKMASWLICSLSNQDALLRSLSVKGLDTSATIILDPFSLSEMLVDSRN